MASRPQPSTVVVDTARGETRILAWAGFVGARLSEPGGGEQLEISFTRHQVVILGRNLYGLLDDLAGLRIASLNEMPAPSRVVEFGVDASLTLRRMALARFGAMQKHGRLEP